MLAAVNPVPATPFQLAHAFAAGQGTVTVGRVEDNVISAIRLNNAAPAQLPDKLINMVSRRHARLEVVAGHLELTDLGAVNGTYVNGARIETGSRRVLQENDVISFGGPATINTRGQQRPNPWVWRVRQLQQFLASYVPPSQAPPPAQQAAAAAAAATAGVAPTLGQPAREVYSFSPVARPSGQAAAAAALPPGTIVAGPPAEEEEEVISPEQAAARGGMTQPGSIPLSGSAALAVDLGSPAPGAAAPEAGAPAAGSPQAPAGEPASSQQAQQQRQQQQGGAAPPDESDDSAGLAALAAYEAYVASQQGSAPQQQQQPAPAHAIAAAAAAAPQRQAPTVQVQLPQAADDDVVDLTADSPDLVPTNHLLAGGNWAAGRAGGGAAAADVVDLLDASPTKRRHGEDAGQDAKRARPSPEARMPRPAAAIGQAPVPTTSDGAGPSAPAAAAAVGEGGGAAQPLNVVSALSDAAPTCAICQEMPVVTHAMVPCGHSFCGECLAEWLSKKPECPTCRKAGEAAPLRNHDMDRMIDMLVSLSAQGAGLLSDGDLEARKQRMATWESKRTELEAKLAAPWARGARRGGGGGGGGAADGGAYGGMLSALAASILGGGGLGGFGMLGGDPLGGLGHLPAPAAAPRQRRPPQIVPPRPAVPPPNEYRAEVTPTTVRCAACSTGFGETAARIGQRPQAQPRGVQAAYRWYHLGCLPASSWHEARARGVVNLRNLPPAQLSRVREHMQLPAAPAQPQGRRRYAM